MTPDLTGVATPRPAADVDDPRVRTALDRTMLLGFGLVIAYWLFESLFDAYRMGHLASLRDLLEPLELMERLPVSVLIMAVPALVARRNRAEALNRDLLDREREVRGEAEAARARMTGILESITDQFYALDRDWRFTYLNAKGEEFLGRPRARLLGRSIWEEFPQTVGGLNYREYHLAVEEQRSRVFEAESRIWPGRWLEVHAYPSPGGLSVYCRDVTDRKKTQKALHESRERFRLMIEGSEAVFFYTHAPDHRFTYLSPSVREVLGYDVAELLGRPYDVVLAGDHVDELLVHHWTDQALRTGQESPAYVARTRHKEGRLVVLELVESPLLRDGEVIGIQGFARDITERVRSQEALAESEARFRTLVENISEAVLLLDADASVRYASPGFERINGYAPEERVGRPVFEHVHPEDLASGREEWRRLVSIPGETLSLQPRVRHRDGQWRTLDVVARNLLEDPVIRGIVVTLKDVTDRRTLEEQLRQAQKLDAVGRLAGGVAHDFNNMLTAIRGYADMLGEDLDGEDPRKDNVEEIARTAGRAAGLTRQLLAFSRQQVLKPRVVDLNRVVRDLERMLGRLIPADIVLDLTLAPDLGPVRADPGQLEQVIMNLVVNAEHAMPEGGRIVIETRNAAAAPFVELTVSDTGVGMDEETRSKIFEPFFTTRGAGEGTGLGLSTVYGIVQQSGGHIAVRSEPGRGAQFTVFLPREDVEEPGPCPEARADDEAAAPPVSETVLVVEDEAAVRNVARRLLERRGYTVLTADDGAQALDICARQEGPIDLVVTDVVMPGMSGREMVERFAACRPGTPVLFMSGYTRDEIIRRGIADDGILFLEKPFTPAALTRKVREALDRRVEPAR